MQYSYDDRSIVVVNSYYEPFTNLKITAKIYNLDMTEKFSKQVELSVAPDSSTRVFQLPSLTGLSTTYFVILTLESDGQTTSRNFYWLSTREETLDWARQELDSSGQYDISTWIPTKTFADYTSLNKLPRVDLDARAQYEKRGEENRMTITLRNATSTLAFALHLKVNRPSDRRVNHEAQVDDEILPVLWQDNYFVLLPGETRRLTATFRMQQNDNTVPTVELDGWNVHQTTVEVRQ